MSLWEALAYQVARGVVRGYLDVLRERETASDELVTDDDRERARRL